MVQRVSPGFSRSLLVAAVVGLGSLGVGMAPAKAASGPFAEFSGKWSGTGTLKPDNGSAERIRCNASYQTHGSTSHNIDLQLRCASDSYNFDLTGQFQADDDNRVSGNWTERSRSIGGTVNGVARGDRLQLHIESNAFAAEVVLLTHERRQTVTIDSQGGGQVIKASITLSRH